MAQSEIVTGLDIGSSTVKAVVLRRFPDGSLQVVGVAESTSEGIARGMITNIEDAVTSISEVLEQLERMISLPVDSAVVGISGNHIKTLESTGVVAVSKADREITEEDIERAIAAAQTVATPPNYEILHVIPRIFTVDNQSGIKDPLGMKGVRLEVATQIIIGLSSQIKNLTKCIYRTGVDINDLVFNVLAGAESTLNKKQKELGVALINLGAQTTNLIVYEEGDILHTAVLPIGSNHITNDIAIGLRTSVETAEAVKLEVAVADSDLVNKRDEIDLAKFSASEKDRTMISLKHIAEITQARCEEIFNLIDKELKKINRSGLLPAGVVLTGGGAKLNGLIDLAKEKLKLPVFLGLPSNLEQSGIDKINDPAFTTALGLALWGGSSLKKRGRLNLPNFSAVDQAVGKMKSWFKSLLP
jgi:cell division protein FtsA